MKSIFFLFKYILYFSYFLFKDILYFSYLKTSTALVFPKRGIFVRAAYMFLPSSIISSYVLYE